ncbi:MAG: FAD-binding oxidoreductase, partial [Candidatus Kapabacteria bacterium]|nr:FAD-binding oxidoreductase [Candidatus Kapabacteria bacterium]
MDTLRQLLGKERVSTRIIDRLAFAHDASLYRLIPDAVVRPSSREHVQALMLWCTQSNRHLTFRAGGTSLSGQAVTNGILVDLSRDWKHIEILDGGLRVRMQPGITGARVNAHLRRFGQKLGPDPASIIAAMIGGIVANNASGMCCGTKQNSYNTLDSMQYILADGTAIDTANPDADSELQQACPDLHAGLLQLRNDVFADAELLSTIDRKYQIKNTIGYSLNALVDEHVPARIIARLLIGSEGTLGFIESVTLKTIPDAVNKTTAIIMYGSIDEACDDVAYWRDAGAAAVEIMDDASLRSFAFLPTTPVHLRNDTPGAAALLIEFHDCEPPTGNPSIRWTTDPHEQATLWRLRKGLMPSIGAMRPPGSTMINEDIAVPAQHLAALVKDVRALFVECGYDEGIIFGHAKDGNIHFVIHQSFETEAEINRYVLFMERIAQIVVGTYGGSLKAEHGTGRNMTPFVEMEWGSTAYAIMHRIKALLDPHGILSPGVLLNNNPRAHIENIKPVPVIGQPEVDLCIECGFCEHVCPSRGITLTPRQRIVLQRERVLHAGSPSIVQEIDNEFVYDGIETCATDGICSTVCPVGIDTGTMITEMRHKRSNSVMKSLSHVASRNMRFVNLIARTATSVIRRYGTSHVARPTTVESPEIYYFQTCPSKWFGLQHGELPLNEVVTTLAQRANVRMQVIDSNALCCGQPFSSKGCAEDARHLSATMVSHMFDVIKEASASVLLDTSTCAAAIRDAAIERGITVIDQIAFS